MKNSLRVELLSSNAAIYINISLHIYMYDCLGDNCLGHKARIVGQPSKQQVNFFSKQSQIDLTHSQYSICKGNAFETLYIKEIDIHVHVR